MTRLVFKSSAANNEVVPLRLWTALLDTLAAHFSLTPDLIHEPLGPKTSGLRFQYGFKFAERFLSEQDHAGLRDRTGFAEETAEFTECDFGGFTQRIAVNACADGGKRDGSEFAFGGHREAGFVARSELRGFPFHSAVKYRSHGVKDVLSFEAAG